MKTHFDKNASIDAPIRGSYINPVRIIKIIENHPALICNAIAICDYLLIAILKKTLKPEVSLNHIMQLLSVSLF